MDNQTMADGGRWVPVRDVRLGDYVRFVEGGPVWVRSEYCRKDKRFYLDRFSDINAMTKRKGDCLVLVGFTF